MLGTTHEHEIAVFPCGLQHRACVSVHMRAHKGSFFWTQRRLLSTGLFALVRRTFRGARSRQLAYALQTRVGREAFVLGEATRFAAQA